MQLLEAKVPQAAIGVEAGDTRVDARCVPRTPCHLSCLTDWRTFNWQHHQR